MTKVIKMLGETGDFAEDKEVARSLRVGVIMPALANGEKVMIDFAGVEGATQSFVHALTSDPIRKYGDVAYDNLYYVNANDEVRKIISIVYRYMQESLED